ncbi:class I SAM-dependent methyltransferase [Caldimonas sp.]|uniref:class I SAM-dependent methyltransferase n=1 Tax=Caldimonas sp. TaxID=2838790 RepID=UPI00391C9AF8
MKTERLIDPSTPAPPPSDGLRLNLGCGSKRIPGFIGIDIGEGSAVDVRMDVMEYLRSLPDHSVQDVYTRHFLEHVDGHHLRPMLLEIDRVLRPGGSLHIIVPHYSNPYFYSDPTHRLFFGVHTFSYFCERSCLHRTVPRYATIPGWSLDQVRVGFKPYARPRLLGVRVPMLSGLLNRVVNRSTLGIELFERYLCGLFSIYEVEYRIRKRGS